MLAALRPRLGHGRAARARDGAKTPPPGAFRLPAGARDRIIFALMTACAYYQRC